MAATLIQKRDVVKSNVVKANLSLPATVLFYMSHILRTFHDCSISEPRFAASRDCAQALVAFAQALAVPTSGLLILVFPVARRLSLRARRELGET